MIKKTNHTGNLDQLESRFTPRKLQELNARFEGAHPDEILKWGFQTFGSDMVLGTGFGPSGVYLIDRIMTNELFIPIFYLDTQLLFDETYTLRDQLEERYGIDIIQVLPELSPDQQADKHGDALWKKNPDKCCYMRKVLPLKKFLSDKKAWITGVRRNQSETRQKTEVIEWDPVNEVIKVNPLAIWTNEQVWEYILERDLPYNPLHDDGYPSIGCIPCTQPADSDYDERSGRWKDTDKTECGIHIYSQEYQNGNGKHRSDNNSYSLDDNNFNGKNSKIS
ncbi:MAG: phosphoadenylyl-sulfate reductase [Balneolaceae bacterium]